MLGWTIGISRRGNRRFPRLHCHKRRCCRPGHPADNGAVDDGRDAGSEHGGRAAGAAADPGPARSAGRADCALSRPVARPDSDGLDLSARGRRGRALGQTLRRTTELTGDALTNALQAQSWDPSVKALVPFPRVLENMSNQLQWTEAARQRLPRAAG